MKLDPTRDHRRTPAFFTGIVLSLLAAVLMVATDVHVAAPITLLICGISFIGNSRPSG